VELDDSSPGSEPERVGFCTLDIVETFASSPIGIWQNGHIPLSARITMDARPSEVAAPQFLATGSLPILGSREIRGQSLSVQSMTSPPAFALVLL